jgi:hypothetical protein
MACDPTGHTGKEEYDEWKRRNWAELAELSGTSDPRGHQPERAGNGLYRPGVGSAFAQLYGKLTDNDPDTAFLTFMGAMQGLNGGVTSDDPFGVVTSVRTALEAIRPGSDRPVPPRGRG